MKGPQPSASKAGLVTSSLLKTENLVGDQPEHQFIEKEPRAAEHALKAPHGSDEFQENIAKAAAGRHLGLPEFAAPQYTGPNLLGQNPLACL